MVAFILGLLCPGLGHFYLSRIKQGLCYFSFALLSGFLHYYVSGVSWILFLVFISIFYISFIVPFLHLLFILIRGAKRIKKPSNSGINIIILLIGFWSLSIVFKSYPLYKSYSFPSTSMSPTLVRGDMILAEKNIRGNLEVKKGDLVVFKYPLEPSTLFIKRVIAVAGDVVSTRNGKVNINGEDLEIKKLPESSELLKSLSEVLLSSKNDNIDYFTVYSESLGGKTYKILFNESERGNSYGPTTVPEGQIFVLGDNRSRSFDSRKWGFVPSENVVGKARYIILNTELEDKLSRAGLTIN